MRVTRFLRLIFALTILTIPALRAAETPSWAVRDAVDKLIAKNALFTPGRDGFLKKPNGKLVQYELPENYYTREGRAWQVEIRSRRWRAEGNDGWLGWISAPPNYDYWNIGSIRIEVLLSGVSAKWINNSNFLNMTAPSQSEVTQHLDNSARGNLTSPRVADAPLADKSVTWGTPRTVPDASDPTRGIFKAGPNGTLQKIQLPDPTPALRGKSQGSAALSNTSPAPPDSPVGIQEALPTTRSAPAYPEFMLPLLIAFLGTLVVGCFLVKGRKVESNGGSRGGR